jgi:4,4'-diaponeurosporenoate glycosyltransferase
MGSALIIVTCVFCWLIGFGLFWRMPICRASTTSDIGRLSIIIPARNEEETLPMLLRSINEQGYRPFEVIVVDDASTDRTEAVAKELGASVLASSALPEGWRGKTWACQQGAAASHGDHLLFLDADTWFEPEGLRRIVNAYASAPGVLSVAPYHKVVAPYEQLSAYFNLIMVAGIGAFTPWHRQPDGLFGQMMMLDRPTYDRFGGHERVKDKVLENLWLAADFRAADVPIRCMVGRQSLSFRMYPNGAGDMIDGWSKSFASGARATAKPILFAAIAWLSGAVMAVTSALQNRGCITASLYGLYALQCFILLRRIGSFRWYTAVFFPIPLLFFFSIFARSMAGARQPVMWKGRAVHAD